MGIPVFLPTLAVVVLFYSAVNVGAQSTCRFIGHPSQIINLGGFDEDTPVGSANDELLELVLDVSGGSTFQFVFPSTSAYLDFYHVPGTQIIKVFLKTSFDDYLETFPGVSTRRDTLSIVCNSSPQTLNLYLDYNIQDINDNCAKFDEDQYESNVTTQWPPQINLNSVSILLRDNDYTLPHTEVVLTTTKDDKLIAVATLLSQRPFVYSIGLKLLDDVQLSLDDEATFTITATSTDGKCLATTEYTFSVEKINMFPPVFTKSLYSSDVDNFPVVGDTLNPGILATDADDSDFEYTIGPDSTADIVTIEKDNGGIIFTKNIDQAFCDNLDKRKTVNVELIAKETAEPEEKQLSSKSVLSIFFDCPVPNPGNPPIFTKSVYFAEVPDLPNAGTRVDADIAATDPDSSPFEYLLGSATHDIVKIDPSTGQVELIVPITKEFVAGLGRLGMVQIELIAKETELPHLYSTSLLIIVFTYEEEVPGGGSPPVFLQPFYKVEYTQLPDAGLIVNTNILAVDPDNDPFEYIIGDTTTHRVVNFLLPTSNLVRFSRTIDEAYYEGLGIHKIITVELIAREKLPGVPEAEQLFSKSVLILLFYQTPTHGTSSPCLPQGEVEASTEPFVNVRRSRASNWWW